MDRSHAALMDKNFRYMKYVYDISRPFFLAGRAAMRRRAAAARPMRVLEVGCGTGRNLIRLARILPQTRFVGIDISSEMIGYARKRIDGAGLASRISVLTRELGDHLDRAEPPDAIIFSYSLSMIPDWKTALRQAAQLARQTQGTILVVDFFDMGSWPLWFRRRLYKNVAYFHVSPCPEVIDFIQTDPAFHGSAATSRTFFGGYAILLEIRMDGSHRPEAAQAG